MNVGWVLLLWAGVFTSIVAAAALGATLATHRLTPTVRRVDALWRWAHPETYWRHATPHLDLPTPADDPTDPHPPTSPHHNRPGQPPDPRPPSPFGNW